MVLSKISCIEESEKGSLATVRFFVMLKVNEVHVIWVVYNWYVMNFIISSMVDIKMRLLKK